MPPASGPDRPAYAVVLAGGAGRRLGRVDKPALVIGDGTVPGRLPSQRPTTLLDIALKAVSPALPVVVGPTRALPPGILQTVESPAGGGPCAALVAGVAALLRSRGDEVTDSDLVVILAADLPGITAATVDLLAASLLNSGSDGAVLIDPDGRHQYLAGVWRLGPLRTAIGGRADWDRMPVSDLLRPLIGSSVPVDDRVSSDVDLPEDLVRWGIRPPSRSGDQP